MQSTSFSTNRSYTENNPNNLTDEQIQAEFPAVIVRHYYPARNNRPAHTREFSAVVLKKIINMNKSLGMNSSGNSEVQFCRSKINRKTEDLTPDQFTCSDKVSVATDFLLNRINSELAYNNQHHPKEFSTTVFIKTVGKKTTYHTVS